MNENHLCKVCPFGDPVFYSSSATPITHFLSSPPKLDWGATCNNEPGAALGGWVGENSVDSGAGFTLLVGCTCLEWT